MSFPSQPALASFVLLLVLIFDATMALRVMTFNIWLSGAEVHDGLEKIAKHIKEVNPDIVALQEVETPEVVPNITSLLGAPWSGVHHCNATYPDTAILTKHQIINGTYTHVDYGMSVKIQLPSGKQVSMWSLHLDYRSYGPYAAYNKLVTNESQIMAGEFPYTTTGRVQNMVQLLTSRAFRQDIQKSQIVPVIVAGDFNAPSDLDWVEGNRNIHGGWIFPWPATAMLRDTTGILDSFRVLYPDPVSHPGVTWSTVNKFNKEWDYTIQEPTDRIDFVNYLGPLRPVRSETYCGSQPMKRIPNQWDNDYPSDHYAVFTDFEELKPAVAEGADSVKPDIKELDKELIRRLRSATDGLKTPTPMCENTIYMAV